MSLPSASWRLVGHKSLASQQAAGWQTVLWLLRHPRPLQAEGRCYGRLDLAADPQHLEQTVGQLAGQLPSALRLCSSPARRCRALADALLAAQPAWQDQGTLDWLAEMDFGDWEGRRWADLPDAQLSAWAARFSDYRAGGCGESVRQFLARVGDGLAALLDAQPGADGQSGAVLLGVTHAGVIRAMAWLVQAAEGAMPAATEWPAFEIGFGELWCLQRHDGITMPLPETAARQPGAAAGPKPG